MRNEGSGRGWIGGLLFSVAASLLAQPKPSVDEVLTHVAETYDGLSSFEFAMSETPRPHTHSVPTRFAMAQGKTMADYLGTRCITDGTKTWQFDDFQRATGRAFIRYYTQYDAELLTLAEAVTKQSGCNRIIALARDTYVDRWKRITDWVPKAEIVREETVKVGNATIPCWMIEVHPFGSRAQVWIDKSRYLILRETYRGMHEGVNVRRDWSVAKVASADVRLFDTAPAGYYRYDPGKELIGKLAPDFKFQDRALSSLKGKVVILYFWATWTPHVDDRMKAFEHWWHQYQDADAALVGVSYEKAEVVEKFTQKHQIDFPNYMDLSRELHTAYGIQLLPTVIVLDSEGVVRHYFNQDDNPEEWMKAAADLP